MSGRGWLSSRVALGALGGGVLLLAGGCAFIYDFDNKYTDGTGSAVGATGTGGNMPTSSGSMSGGGGSGGSGGSGGMPCMFSDDCAIEALSEEPSKGYGDISLGGALVFWVRAGGFSSHSKGITTETIAEKLTGTGVQHIAADGDELVYFALTNDVKQYIIDTDLTPDVMLNTNPTGLTVRMNYVYWPSMEGPIHMGKPMDTMSFPDETGTSPFLISASEGADQVYWTYLGSDPTMATGGVKRLDKGDVAIDQNLPTGIAADGEDVYWITREGKIHKYSYTKNETTEREPPFSGIEIKSGRVAVSEDHVYWLGPDPTSCAGMCVCEDHVECGAVLRVSKKDITGSIEIFADLNWPVLKGLAVDTAEKFVYWTTGDLESKLLRKAYTPE